MTTKQTPIGSGYGTQTIAREVIGKRRLDGAIAVVTRGYAGVGLETTRALSAAGEEIRAAVVRACEVSPLITAEQGAATSVWCAINSLRDGMGGVYCENVDIARAVPADLPELRGVRPWAIDPGFAERSWTMSEEWTGVAFSV